MADCENLGKRIRAARRKRKITQQRLAGAVGVGTTHISHIENGKSMPSMEIFVKIINTFNCSADELLSPEEE